MKKIKLHTVFLLVTIIMIPIIVFVSGLIKDSMEIRPYYEQLFEKAQVIKVMEEELSEDPVVENLMIGRQVVLVEVLSGKYKGELQEVVNVIDLGHNVVTKNNQKIIVGIRETEEGPNVWIYNHQRSHVLYFLILLFLGLMLYFGGKKGLDAIVALLFTTTMLVFVLLPLIFNGADPIISTVLCALISSMISFVLIGGFEKKTLIAILGTVCGIVTAGTIALLFSKWANIFDVYLDRGTQLVYMALDFNIKIKGLLFASILIASMGAVMDVSMSIASSMYEIYCLDKKVSFKKFFLTGMNIGKDIMGTMANTLILAFMGGSLSLMLLLWGYNMTLIQLLNMPFVSLELIQGLAGSIGIVLTVPFTAFMASIIYRYSTNKNKSPQNQTKKVKS